MTSAVNRAVNSIGFNSAIMPALGMEVDWEPSIGITAARLQKLGLGIESFREPLTIAVREVMIPSIRRNFQAGGRPAWAPLALDTVAQKSHEGFSTGSSMILRRSGNLYDAAGRMSIWRITSKSAVVAHLPEDVWYGALHQSGGSGGSISDLLRKHGGNISKAIAERNATIATNSTLTSDQHPGGLPARPFLMIHDEDEIKIMEIFDAWLTKQIAESMA